MYTQITVGATFSLLLLLSVRLSFLSCLCSTKRYKSTSTLSSIEKEISCQQLFFSFTFEAEMNARGMARFDQFKFDMTSDDCIGSEETG